MSEVEPARPVDPRVVYRRVLLKLSGEALMGEQAFGIDPDLIQRIAGELIEVTDLGVELAIVIGGGNIFRGVAGIKHGIDRISGDHMGMLATVINALALMCALEAQGCEVRVQTAIQMHEVAEPFIQRRAERHLERGRIVIFAAGTGHPYFSTDTAAALRASQIGADALLMAKHGTDGVYDDDPNLNPAAVRFDELDYDRCLALAVMDPTATAMAKAEQIPIVVFDFADLSNIQRIVRGEAVGTIVRSSNHAG